MEKEAAMTLREKLPKSDEHLMVDTTGIAATPANISGTWVTVCPFVLAGA